MRHAFSSDKMYTYIKGFAKGSEMPETVKILNFVRELHKDQKRKDGEPYIIHPLTLTCHALALGVRDDNVIATLLLHDVVEDCGISINDIPCNKEILTAVNLLTYRKPKVYFEKDGEGISIETVKDEYYKEISKNGVASICKLFDRCHNVSSMAGTFTSIKLLDYLYETERYILPLLRETKEKFPEYQDILFVLKYHIISVLDAVKGTMKTYHVE
jgi:GTP pyrophosphokinase